ncbi:hypothetical protein PV327_002516 [Microctonus hyperodae]|uniref:Calponin-homology (CH) domain-containing protein n=1 Tax=Microctonus hyperodae TaxID=165561 RepID=A0AA39KP67_MICHY|nr:hypothetical protein PV327_002516 [Microctonus hyperodae]
MEVVYIDELQDVQKKTFTKWINSQLVKHRHEPVSDLFIDLRDGNKLLTLLEVLESKTHKRERGRMRVHFLNNVNKALQILEQNNVKLVNISSNDIVDGNPKLTLGLVWSIILHYQVHNHLKDLMSELQQTNLERTLLAWCRLNSQNYPGVDIKNFTTSWSDGLAFNALLHKWKPHLFNFNDIARKHPNARLDFAFRLAHDELNIERLLDPEDVNTSIPDKKSIMMYVMCLFQSLPHSGDDITDINMASASDSSQPTTPSGEQSELSIANLGMPVSRPMSLATNISVELGGYQVALEEVLTWLLEAEDKLNHTLEPDSSLNLLKEQFHEHENFLIELSSHQDGVGTVLEEGARLLAEGGLQKDEEHEVRIQMSLLNSRWEGLRMRAMERQSRIHKMLTDIQQAQLDELRKWLTKMEDKISRTVARKPKELRLNEHLNQLYELEKEIEQQRGIVDNLKNIIVVVDEENSDTIYSQMEDQLSALDERWSHICKWKNEWSERLKSYFTTCEEIKADYMKLVGSVNATEITVKQMEAVPVSEIGEILERIKRLRIVKNDMELNQNKLLQLQTRVQDFSNDVTIVDCNDLFEKIENLQDQWEAVGQIMDVQSQRISNSGFDLNLKTGTIINSDNNWMTETVTSIAHSEEISGRHENNVTKKQKITNTTRQDFESALINLYKWLDYVDFEIGRIDSAFDTFNKTEETVGYAKTVIDIESHKKEYERVLELGKQLIDELTEQGESNEMEKSKITDVQKSWDNINDRMQEIQRRRELAIELEQIHTELTDLRKILDEYYQWFNENEENEDIEVLKAKIELIKMNNERLENLKMRANILMKSSENIATDDINTIKIEIEQFSTHREDLLERLSKRIIELTKLIEKIPPEEYTNAMDSLLSFISNTEKVILSEHGVLSDENTMQNQLTKFKKLQESTKDFIEKFNYVNSFGKEFIEKMKNDQKAEKYVTELDNLNSKWSNVLTILEERQQKLIKDIESLEEFNRELSNLEEWLDTSSKYLSEVSSKELSQDVDTIQSDLQQIQTLLKQIPEVQPRIENVQTKANQLLENSEPKFSVILNNRLESISQKWHPIIDNSNAEREKLEAALKKNDEIVNGVDDFTEWLSRLEQEIPSNNTVTSAIELFQIRGVYQSLKDKIDARVEEFRTLNELGNDKLLNSEGSSAHELGRRFTFLNARWTDVTDRIYEHYRQLQNASHEYGEFRALVVQENDRLDKLEKSLRKSIESAADAEEISEKLDDLENHIRNHPDSRFEKIQEIGKQLVESNIMTRLIREDVEDLENRWNNLHKQADERAQLLEGSVKQAQQLEGRILTLQQSLMQADSILTAHLDTNLTADDLSHDYQKLIEEVENQRITLQEVKMQIDDYKSTEKYEAANRLKEQMTLIEKKFSEVQNKFDRFCRTSNLEPRISRALCELRGIEEATCLLELASPDVDTIENQLDHCLRFYQTLSEIKSEIENIIVTGRKQVAENSVPEPEEFSKRIDGLKDLYNKLGVEITEKKSNIITALKLTQDIHQNMTNMNMCLDKINIDLDNQKYNPDSSINGIYVNKTMTEIIPKLNILKHQTMEYQNKFIMMCEPSCVEQINEKMSSIVVRLANTERRLRIISGIENEPDVTEINAWLLQMENKILEINALPNGAINEQHIEQCKAIQSEVQEAKSKIIQLQHYSFYPKVSAVCEKWESIVKNIETTAKQSMETLQLAKMESINENSPSKKSKLSKISLEKNIIEFEHAAQLMSRRIDIMLLTIGNLSNEKDPAKRLEILNSEVSSLAPDAASLISRGDGLVMTVHTMDPVRAEKIKNEHQDKLRRKWHQVMTEVDGRRIQAQNAERLLNQYKKSISELETWFKDVPLKLEQANNYEGQLESFTDEFLVRQSDVEQLNKLCDELKKLNIEYHETVHRNINTRWYEISSQFKKYSNSKDKNKFVTDKKMGMGKLETINITEFEMRFKKLRDAMATVLKSINSTPLNGKDYELFQSQEECLKKISNTLNILKSSVEEMCYLYETSSLSLNRTQSEQLGQFCEKLNVDWIIINRQFTERYNRWTKCSDKWKEFCSDNWTFNKSLNEMLDVLERLPNNSAEANAKLADIDKEISKMQQMLNSIEVLYAEIAAQSSTSDILDLQTLMDRSRIQWQKLITEFNVRREKSNAVKNNLKNSDWYLEMAYTIVDQVNSLVTSKANPSDDTSLTIRLALIKDREKKLISLLNEIEIAKNHSENVELNKKYGQLLSELHKAQSALSSHRDYVEKKIQSLNKYINSLDTVMTWIMETRTRLNISQELYFEERNKVIENIMSTVADREMEVKNILENYTNIQKECDAVQQPVSVELQEKLKKLREDWQYVKNRGEFENKNDTEMFDRSRSGSNNENETCAESLSSSNDSSRQSASISVKCTTQRSLKNSPNNTISVNAFLPSSTSSPFSSVAERNQSVNQISDWLSSRENMLRQQAVSVGDVDEILQLLDKQSNVLRELEQKKPQLDELVHTAENLRADTNRQQLHGKVTKLREHWDETNSKVMQRKAQLDAMLSDSQRYERKRHEQEVWLERMELRLTRMRSVGHTADVLETQLREQKSFHAELHQYKHQMELFNQLTQSLIAMYQDDDTTRVKKMTEMINQRYNNLNTSIINRGKLLHSAMNSLHNFDRSLDKFLAWLSEAESSMEGLETEADRLGGRRDQGALRRPQHQLRDLQSEIETHRDVYASLNGAGRKLLGSLASQDDAVMLQRRLDEMNQRWHHLKAKSMAIRNRLESNTEHWNALLLSLRELSEWVIRKDTELTGLEPVRGDINALQKQQVSFDLSEFYQ